MPGIIKNQNSPLVFVYMTLKHEKQNHALHLLQPSNMNDLFDSTILLSVSNVLLRHCKDYETLKRIQSSSLSFYSLFTCREQFLWKELCLQNHFTSLIKRDRRFDLKKYKFVWEIIFYQNWKVNLNWSTGNAHIYSVYLKNDIFLIERHYTDINNFGLDLDMKGIASSAHKYTLPLHMIHGSNNIMISTSLEPNGTISIWDFERRLLILKKRIRGLVTCKHLWKNLLIIGNDSGEIEIIKLKYNNYIREDNSEFKSVVLKLHAHEISFITHDEVKKEIISSDTNGLIISFSLPFDPYSKEDGFFDTINIGSIIPKVFFDNQSVGITFMTLYNQILYVTTMMGDFIKITRNTNGIGIQRVNFSKLNSLNCITQSGNCLYFGSDAGVVIKHDVIKKTFEEYLFYTQSQQPVTAITSDSNRLAIGYFDGTVSIVNLNNMSTTTPGLGLNFKNHNHSGPIWNLTIDELKLISSSLDGITILRTFL